MKWQNVLVDYFPEATKLGLNNQEKAEYWVAEINDMLHKTPLQNRDELLEAIRWAGRTINREDTFNAPSVSEIAGWVKRYRLDVRTGDAPKHAENQSLHDMPPDVREEILALYKPFRTEYKDVEIGYRELEGGEALEPTDEYNDEGEWKVMGDKAYENDRPRRLVKYASTSVRREVKGQQRKDGEG